MRVYFDSVLWIDYAWGLFNSTGKIKKNSRTLVNFVKSNQIEVITSVFTSAEIFNHFKDWFLLQKTIEDGYSYREFSKLKKKYGLTKNERIRIDQAIESILELEWVTPLESDGLNEDELNVFEQLTLQHSIDSIDALHSIAAAQSNCRYLVTKDESFIEDLNGCLKRDGIHDHFEAIKPRTFMNKKPWEYGNNP